MLNENKTNRLSIRDTELLHKDAATSTDHSRIELEDGETSTHSTEDVAFQKTSISLELKDKEPMFVIVDSSCISNPSSQELLVENRKATILKKHNNKNYVIPDGIPSTSRDIISENIIAPHLAESESANELQMIEINLQSENEIPLDAIDESDKESIVISYLQNKELNLDNIDGTLISTKKKSSILEDVPKMETILEGEQFSSFPLKSTSQLPEEDKPDIDTPENDNPEEPK